MSNKVSVITVVFNDVEHIKQTMESYFSQTWEDKEYIVIDGGSTDGTADVVSEYADRLAYWCSEPDGGIFDAMNKGVQHATGKWVNFLNSGDYFVSPTVLATIFADEEACKADVIYGDSIEITESKSQTIVADSRPAELEHRPIYRHGSSLTRTSVHKQNLFDLNKRPKLGYALDWEMIYRVFKAGFKFYKVDTTIEAYLAEGTSNHTFRNLWYNYLITSQGRFSPGKAYYLAKETVREVLKKTGIYDWLKAFGTEYLLNDVLPHIPFWCWRGAYMRLLGAKTGKGSFIMKKNYVLHPWRFSMGEHSHVNRDCIIDARGGVTIGSNVSISHRVSILTGSHDYNSQRFDYTAKRIVIDDYAWIGAGCTILQGVHIGEGAVVCAGAVVTKDVAPYTVVGGIPAKKLRERRNDLDYHCSGWQPFT